MSPTTSMNAQDVFDGKSLWSVEQGDCIEWFNSLPPNSVDLVFGSPPYEQARLYLEGGKNMGIARDTEAWVAWMVTVTKAALRVCKGLVAWVVEGQTRKFKYTCSPALLIADLHRAGITLRKPPIFKRVGIPGSGGPDWLRSDSEWIVCATNGGELLWSDNAVMGHPPKWAPGGAMSYRGVDGTRKNAFGVRTDIPIGTRPTGNKKSGKENYRAKSNRQAAREAGIELRTTTSGTKNGDCQTQGTYLPPVLANPGNVIQYTPSESEIILFLSEYADASGKHPDEILQSLQEAIRAETDALWCLGAYEQIHGAKVLQSSVHGRGEINSSGRGASEGTRPILCPKAVSGQTMQEVQNDQAAHQASCGRESDQQLEREHRNTLPPVSQHTASSDAESSDLSSLREASPFIGFVRGSLLPLQKAWRSVEEMYQQSLWHRGQSSDVITCLVGGSRMGSPLAHISEAPFPESLAEFFIKSFCPEKGIVCDPFSGSGTTEVVAVATDRRAIACDLRESQVELTKRRMAEYKESLGIFRDLVPGV